jgi:hypothetical protein
MQHAGKSSRYQYIQFDLGYLSYADLAAAVAGFLGSAAGSST